MLIQRRRADILQNSVRVKVLEASVLIVLAVRELAGILIAHRLGIEEPSNVFPQLHSTFVTRNAMTSISPRIIMLINCLSCVQTFIRIVFQSISTFSQQHLLIFKQFQSCTCWNPVVSQAAKCQFLANILVSTATQTIDFPNLYFVGWNSENCLDVLFLFIFHTEVLQVTPACLLLRSV